MISVGQVINLQEIVSVKMIQWKKSKARLQGSWGESWIIKNL